MEFNFDWINKGLFSTTLELTAHKVSSSVVENHCRTPIYIIFVGMKKTTKSLLYTLTFILIVITMNACHSKGPYNPYLDMKVKPHQEEGKKTKKAIKKAKKEYRKQLRSNRKAVFGKKKAPK